MKIRSLTNAAVMLSMYMLLFVLYNIGVFPTIMSILLPIPIIIYSVTVGRIRDILLLFIGCFCGTFLFGSIYGVITTLNYGVMGTIIGIGMVKSWPYWQRILNAVIISVLSFPITIYFVSGLNVKESVTQMTGEIEVMIQSIANTLPSDYTAIIGELQRSIDLMATLFPTIVILMGTMSVFLSDTVAILILKKLGISPLKFKKQNIHNIQVGPTLIIVLVIGQLIKTVLSIPTVDYILINVMAIINMLYVLQGIIVILLYFKSRSKIGLGILTVILMLLLGFSIFIEMLGIMDAFFNYRDKLVLEN